LDDSQKASEKAELRKMFMSPEEHAHLYALAALKAMHDEEEKEKKQNEDARDANMCISTSTTILWYC
jgi:hypothetical protein